MKLYRNFIGIYYCTAILVYSTSLLVFFWEIKSLFLRFTLSDTVGFLSYQLAFALLESILIAAMIFIAVSILPIKTIRKYPSAAGVLLAVAFAISSLIYKLRTPVMGWLVTLRISNESTASHTAFLLWVLALCLLPVIAILLAKNEKIALRIQSWIDTLSVLAILYTVLGVLGMIVVLYRNLI
jgi:hypothetical protein